MSEGKSQTYAVKITGFVVLLLFAVWQLQSAVLDQISFTGKAGKNVYQKAMNARQLTNKAKKLYTFDADFDNSKLLLQRALLINPLYVPAWLSLAEWYYDSGSKDKAGSVLDYTTELTRGLKKWRWDQALAAYQTDHSERLPDELSYIVKEIPGKSRRDALQLAFTLWETPEDLLQNIGGENSQHLFLHSVWNKRPDEALFFWKLIEEDNTQWRQNQLLTFLNMLIQLNRIKEAKPIWENYFDKEDILHNGDFSKPFLKTAFGWRVALVKGVDQILEDNPEKASTGQIYYRFKGWDNVNFQHLTQIVPLKGGRSYRLSAKMKSQKMTTNERPFFEVSQIHCSAPYSKTEMVDTTQDWTTHEVDFYVPDDCDAMVVRLRRKKSDHIDNKLQGKLWVKDIKIDDHGKTLDFNDLGEE